MKTIDKYRNEMEVRAWRTIFLADGSHCIYSYSLGSVLWADHWPFKRGKLKKDNADRRKYYFYTTKFLPAVRPE